MFDPAITGLDFTMRLYMRFRSWITPIGIGVTSIGFKMHCDTRDFIQRRVFYFNIYEPNLTYYILSRVRSGDHVVDVGANVGYMTLLLSSIVGEIGKVVAIEASPSTFSLLSRNLELNNTQNVTALNIAATSGPCLVDVVAGEKRNSGSNSIRQASSGATTSVEGDALSNIEEIRHDRVTFIKIDVEGSEAPVLQNIIESIKNYPALKSIAAEITSGSAHLIPLLIANGFRAYALPNNYRIGYLFVRKYLRQSREHEFFIKLPAREYDPQFTDYVFELP